MKDWDDLRFFLAVARGGSIRAAAVQLCVNHSTVSRRIAALETRAKLQLFDRTRGGYELTDAGLQVFESAQRMERDADSVSRQLLGRDTNLAGPLKVTMPNTIATRLVMPDLARFARNFPEIELVIDVSMTMADLVRRQADVAIRVSNDPPGHLFGRRLVKYARSIYASQEYLAAHEGLPGGAAYQWIGWEDKVDHPQWVRESPFPEARIRHRAANTLAHVEAAHQGMGICMLPCFIGDREPGIARVDTTFTEPDREIWILTHEDLRGTARIRQFMKFMAEAILDKQDLLLGNCPS